MVDQTVKETWHRNFKYSVRTVMRPTPQGPVRQRILVFSNQDDTESDFYALPEADAQAIARGLTSTVAPATGEDRKALGL